MESMPLSDHTDQADQAEDKTNSSWSLVTYDYAQKANAGIEDVRQWCVETAPELFLDGKYQCPNCNGELTPSGVPAPSGFVCIGQCLKGDQIKTPWGLLSSIRRSEFPSPAVAFYHLVAKNMNACVAGKPGGEDRQQELLRHLFAYAAVMRWRVFPVYEIGLNGHCTCKKGAKCESPGKHPKIPKWEQRATTDMTQILAWWSGSWCHSNIGIATGAESRIWALDVDGAVGAQNLEDLIAKKGAFPLTVNQITGSGGHHYIFAWPEDGRIIHNSTGLIAEKIDVRGEGGFIVAPPSNHKSGVNYAWV